MSAHAVIPAKAGIQRVSIATEGSPTRWAPACAGATVTKAERPAAVIPAKAGIQRVDAGTEGSLTRWAPAFAGTTAERRCSDR